MALGPADLVVRGGTGNGAGGNSLFGIENATALHPSGVVGISVEAAVGANLFDLCIWIPHSQVGVTTVGDVRAFGGDVTPTSGRSPHHATLSGLDPEQAHLLLTPTVANPVPASARRTR